MTLKDSNTTGQFTKVKPIKIKTMSSVDCGLSAPYSIFQSLSRIYFVGSKLLTGNAYAWIYKQRIRIHFLLTTFILNIFRSFQELTPVEFACETMENVAKELYELIDQYRADSKRNINPFTMRLQGIIDANVMGM